MTQLIVAIFSPLKNEIDKKKGKFCFVLKILDSSHSSIRIYMFF